MKLSNYEWQTKRPRNRTEEAGRQIVLDFGRYHLSIIDDGYGREKGLYEIAVFSAEKGVAGSQIEVKGVTDEGDTVKGYLTESDVDNIITKMYWLADKRPTQV